MKQLKVSEVAERLGFCDKTVYRKIWDGEIPAKKIGRNIRVSEQALEDYLNSSNLKVA
ncbi:helix-turn-helix domain-containing protein [Pontiellaceae bacterium B12219]|nr:helix-turn-helix domain-containing protein [Pontiellaceae bacterium B12219]